MPLRVKRYIFRGGNTVKKFCLSSEKRSTLKGNSSKSFSFLVGRGKRKVQGVPQSQTAPLPRHQEEEETDKTEQAQIEQMYEKH